MNITYLLGAGASANAIPVVEGLNKRIQEVKELIFSKFFPECIQQAQSAGSIKDIELLTRCEPLLLQEFEWMIKESRGHSTVDTLAKKFYLTNEVNLLNRLKSVLTFYFIFEQYIDSTSKHFEKDIERRYDGLLATMLSKKEGELLLPKSLKILSWNYDSQFELSLSNYQTKTPLSRIKHQFQIMPNVTTYENTGGTMIDMNEFCMIKLNGTAIWEYPNNDPSDSFPKSIFERAPFGQDSIHIFYSLVKDFSIFFLQSSKEGYYYLKYFNFAWEANPDFKQKYDGYQQNLEHAIFIAKQTKVLVVIGYSFPTFNREIDRILFSNMNELNTIYIQDRTPEQIKSKIQNAFGTLIAQNNDVNYILETNLKQFIIPFEFGAMK